MVRRLRKVAPQVLPLSLIAAVCWVVGSLAGGTNDLLAASEPTLAGKWTLNQSQSDDSAEKVHAVEKNASSGRRTSGGRPTDEPGEPGVGGPVEHGPLDAGPFGGVWGRAPVGGVPMGGGPIGGGPMGGGPMGGGRGGRAGREYPRRTPNLEGLAATPKKLTIDQNPEQIVVTDDEGHSHTFYLDGKKHKGLNAGGETTSIKTRWEGSRLVAESKLDGSGKLTECFQLAPDGKQLDLTLRLEDSSLGTPLVIHRVYDAAHANPE